jgi:protein-tyrosine phosphatase
VTKLNWLEGPWPGKLALAARPRGGDWLAEDIAGWKRAGVDAVLSLLTIEEEQDLELLGEAKKSRQHGLEFSAFPIPDRQVPASESGLGKALEHLAVNLSSGKNVVVHCRQGVGRSGLIGVCLLIEAGMSPGAAVDSISAARGVPVPETVEQREWIDHYAAAFTK